MLSSITALEVKSDLAAFARTQSQSVNYLLLLLTPTRTNIFKYPSLFTRARNRDEFLDTFIKALGVKSVVVGVADGIVNEIEVLPSRTGVVQHTIYLTLYGSGFGDHYNAACHWS